MWPTNGSTNSRIDNQPCTNKRSDKVIRGVGRVWDHLGLLTGSCSVGGQSRLIGNCKKKVDQQMCPHFVCWKLYLDCDGWPLAQVLIIILGAFQCRVLLKLDVHARLAVQIDLRGLSLLHPHPPAHQHQHHCYLCIREANRKAFFQLILHVGLERFWYICLKRGDFYSLMLSLENGFEEDDRFSGRVSKSIQSKPLQS